MVVRGRPNSSTIPEDDVAFCRPKMLVPFAVTYLGAICFGIPFPLQFPPLLLCSVAPFFSFQFRFPCYLSIRFGFAACWSVSSTFFFFFASHQHQQVLEKVCAAIAFMDRKRIICLLSLSFSSSPLSPAPASHSLCSGFCAIRLMRYVQHHHHHHPALPCTQTALFWTCSRCRVNVFLGPPIPGQGRYGLGLTGAKICFCEIGSFTATLLRVLLPTTRYPRRPDERFCVEALVFFLNSCFGSALNLAQNIQKSIAAFACSFRVGDTILFVGVCVSARLPWLQHAG